MKNVTKTIILIVFISINHSICAQDSLNISKITSKKYIERSPLYDYFDIQLNNTDSIPDFESKPNKLKISGTIYKSDKITPAKNVVLYIEQADENGDFDLRKFSNKQYVYHRAWVKTDANGRYTFYTFIPGNDRRYNQLKQLFPIIKPESKPEYALNSFLFDDDILLSRICRKRIAKKGDPSRILKPKLYDGIFVVEKDIFLDDYDVATK